MGEKMVVYSALTMQQTVAGIQLVLNPHALLREVGK